VATEIQRVGVVGLGTMGACIAQVCVQAGVETVGREVTEELGERARERIEHYLGRGVEKGRLTAEERDAALGRLTTTTELADLEGCDLVIEAVVEELDAKRQIFAELDRLLPSAVLATNTSALPVGEIAAAAERPERVVGMHFFNPAPAMKLVEVVSTVSTSDEVAETVRALCSRIGKVPVSCADRAGFIVNALLFPYLNDAVKMLEAHYATADDIDTAMKKGCALPMGPFELLDVVGNDVSLAIERELYLEFREPGYAPAPLLEHLVTAGYLGRKTGRGFRDYSAR
jgi:3-hydroxybutyryl-CoA dehydrogenase